MTRKIKVLQEKINIYERTLHETINVLLNAMQNKDLDVLDYQATFSVVIGNLLYADHIAGQTEQEEDDDGRC